MMGYHLSVTGNGLSSGTHPGTDSCAMRYGRVMGVLCEMRSIALVHGSDDKAEHQAKQQCKIFLMNHGHNRGTVNSLHRKSPHGPLPK